jgi:hypothetical protein
MIRVTRGHAYRIRLRKEHTSPAVCFPGELELHVFKCKFIATFHYDSRKRDDKSDLLFDIYCFVVVRLLSILYPQVVDELVSVFKLLGSSLR